MEQVKIIKTDNSFNTVLFVALAPDEEDRNGDVITEDEITKTAHDFIRNLNKKAVNVDHKENTDIDNAEFVESFVAPVDISVWDETIQKWSWIIWIKFDEKTYTNIKKWEYIWISIEWKWNRE